MPSKFVWYDLMTPDVKSAAAFYEKVVGWKVADSGMPGMDYWIITMNGDQVGGMMPPPPTAKGRPPMWNGYIASKDVDADSKKAKKLGGMICQDPMDIPGVGRFSVIADPAGATFLLFKDTSGQEQKEMPMGTAGHIAWRELTHDGLDKVWPFYEKMFGWTKTEAYEMGPDYTYQTFSAGDGMIGGMGPMMPDGPPCAWSYYFAVPALDAALEIAKANGGKVVNGPMEVPGNTWIANCIDPQGALFSLFADKR
ncbi:MAG: VOC family protein [Aestuariivirga sp.]